MMNKLHFVFIYSVNTPHKTTELLSWSPDTEGSNICCQAQSQQGLLQSQQGLNQRHMPGLNTYCEHKTCIVKATARMKRQWSRSTSLIFTSGTPGSCQDIKHVQGAAHGHGAAPPPPPRNNWPAVFKHQTLCDGIQKETRLTPRTTSGLSCRFFAGNSVMGWWKGKVYTYCV